MTLLSQEVRAGKHPHGYFAIGIDHSKNPLNIGTLWRTADLFGAAFLFTIGVRYKTQSSDVFKSARHIPLFHFKDTADLAEHLPNSCPLVGIEIHQRAYKIGNFIHPERACYVLGAEDSGLSNDVLDHCHAIVQLPGRLSLNVSVAGSIVLYDRLSKMKEVA